MHHTKEKGDLGVLKAQVDLHQKGWMVLLPLTEHAPFDLVAYKDKRFLRVQVKYREAKNGRLEVHLRSVWNDSNGVHNTPMKKDEIDVICVYCPNTDECYYVNPNDAEKCITLRTKTPKNNQNTGIHPASDYRGIP